MRPSRRSFTFPAFVLIICSAATFAFCIVFSGPSHINSQVREWLGVSPADGNPKQSVLTNISVLAPQGDQFFAGNGTSLGGANWGSTAAGPFTSAFTSGNVANFATVNGTGSGGSITVGGINATESFTITTASGTIANVGNGIVPINVSSGKTLNFFSQPFTSSASAGYIFTGPGTLATSGGAYGGGFTINSGTIVVRGTTSMGGASGNSNNPLTINGGTIAANTTVDLSGRYGAGITVGGDFQVGALSANVPLSIDAANITFSNNMSLGDASRTITIGGNGIYTFAGVVSGGSGVGVTIARAIGSSGAILFSGANTYSGNTTITNGALSLAGTASIANSPVIEIGPGGTFSVNGLTTAFTLSNGQVLRASGTTATGNINTSGTGSFTAASATSIQFSAFNGATPPLTVTGSGKLNLQSTNTVTVTVSHGGTALGVGDYKLIAKSGTASVLGAPSTVTVNGDGITVGAVASLLNKSGELFLHVVSPGTIQFSSATYSAGEGDGATSVTVTRSSGTDGAISVDLSFGSGTATIGSSCTGSTDYVTTTPQTLNWADGDATARVVNITICDDSLYEGGENFNASLSNPTGGATIGTPDASTVTVNDNDTAFALTAAAPADGATNVPQNTSISVTFNRAANASSITVNTADTTCSGSIQLSSDNFATCVQMFGSPAANGSNTVFTAVPATPLAASTTYRIRVTTGARDTFGNALPYAFTEASGFTTSAVTVQFSSATYMGAEGTTTIVTVTRSTTTGTSSVDFATSNNTATSGSCAGPTGDFEQTSGTLTFNDGENAKTFPVALCSDLLIENPAESVALSLSSPSGAVLGPVKTATLKILDVANEFSNDTGITLNTGDISTPYPSTINVSGINEAVNGVRLSLTNVTALDAHNIEILLVDPSGTRTFHAMAAVGGNSPLSGATITLEDSSPNFIPQFSAITDGQNYKPTNCATGTIFPSPAPAGPYGEPGCNSAVDSFASAFGGASANGTWSLYIYEDPGAGVSSLTPDGSIGGWGLQFLTPTAAPVSLGGRVTTLSGVGIRNARITVSGGNLSAPMVTHTSAFGYYRFEGLDAGQTYIVTAEPRRYIIADPTRVVNLSDSIADLNFIAEP